MFGCIAAGRPVQTNLLALSPTQFTFQLPTSPTQPLNHLVIFLLPDTILPPDTAATVYIQLGPDKPFILLGAIANEKPSAIFRVKGLEGYNVVGGGSGGGLEADMDDMVDEAGGGGMNSSSNISAGIGFGDGGMMGGDGATIVTLGISIESSANVQTALATRSSSSAAASSSSSGLTSSSITPQPSSSLILKPQQQLQLPTLIIARRIIKNAFNYLSSFAVKVELPPGQGGGFQDVVSLKSFQDWWVKFEKKVEFDPAVLERED